MRTQRERDDEKRREKLEEVRRQVDDGTLVVRKMTDEERQRFPERPPQDKRPGRGRRS